MKRFSLILYVISMMAVFAGATNAQGRPDRNNMRGGVIREVLEATSVETALPISDILSAIQSDGASLADVIEANGGRVDAVVAVAVESVTQRINQAVEDEKMTQERAEKILANIDQLMTDAINGNLLSHKHPNPRLGAIRALYHAVVEATDIEGQTIIQEVRSGKTLADILVENGSAVDVVVASALETATEHTNGLVAEERITQEQADEWLLNLEQVYTDILNGDFERPFVGGRRSGDRNGRYPIMGVVRQMMEATGLSPQDIVIQLREGSTPADILDANGVDVAAFVDGLLVNTQNRLNDAVESGRITQAQADERLETIRTTLTDRLNSTFQGREMMPLETDPSS